MINKIRNLSNPVKLVIMVLIGLILTLRGWSYNNTPVMGFGIVCFLVAGYCYYIAYKLFEAIIKGDI